MKVMIHKIHRGKALPSVEVGGSYQIIGDNQSVHDYSTVVFPREIADCQTCHDGPDGDLWKTRPSKKNCTSCHDTTSFDGVIPPGMVPHSGGKQPDTAACNACHPPVGKVAGLTETHLIDAYDPAVPLVEVTLLSVANSTPGEQPTITFTVTVGGAPRDLTTLPLTLLRAAISGPNTDYASYWQTTINGTGARGTLALIDAATGTHRYTFPASAAIPLTATGSYTVSMEGYWQPSSQPLSATLSPSLAFAVTDPVAVPRRVIADNDGCNACHRDMSGHGGARRGVQYCIVCHNANNPNDERAPHLEGETIAIPTVDFKVMIHKIHAGVHLTEPYFLGGFPAPTKANPNGTQIDFGKVRFPGILSNCAKCHADGTWRLPVADGVLPTRMEYRTCAEDPAADSDSYCDELHRVGLLAYASRDRGLHELPRPPGDPRPRHGHDCSQRRRELRHLPRSGRALGRGPRARHPLTCARRGVAPVYKSTDAGGTWKPAKERLCGFALAIDPAISSTPYVGSYGGVFKSTDAGRTWQAASKGLPLLDVVSALAVDPTAPTTLYAGTYFSVFKSTDGGDTWRAANSGLPSRTRVHTLIIDPFMPNTVYAGTDRGLFVIEQVCVGNRRGNGRVTIDELVTLVRIALGTSSVSACEPGDVDHDGRITVDEVIEALTLAWTAACEQTGRQAHRPASRSTSPSVPASAEMALSRVRNSVQAPAARFARRAMSAH